MMEKNRFVLDKENRRQEALRIIREGGKRLFRAAVAEAMRSGGAQIAIANSTRNKRLKTVRELKGRKRIGLSRAERLFKDTLVLLCRGRPDKERFHIGKDSDVSSTAAKRLEVKVKSDVSAGLRGIGFTPGRGDSVVKYKDGISDVECHVERKELGTYSRRCTYLMYEYTCFVNLPKRATCYRQIDGIPTLLDRRREKSVGSFYVAPGWMLYKGRGYYVRSEKTFAAGTTASFSGGVTAHGRSVKSAINALVRKMKQSEVSYGVIYPDTVMTASLYQRLTGACRQGTDAWLNAHGFKRSDRMKASELAKILDKSDYGSHEFRRLLEKGERLQCQRSNA